MAFADYQDLVDKMVRAPGGTETIATADRDSAIELARLRYSMDAERKLTEDVVWLADGYFGPLPASWVDGSYLVSAEFPIGEQPLSLIEMDLYVTTSEQQLVNPDGLAAGDTVRVQFTAPHLLNDGETPADTVPHRHREAVASYAAHILCKQLATLFSGERDASINADGSNTESRARNFAFRAKDYRAAYYAGIGKADPQADKGGGAVGDAAASVSAWEGRPRNSLTRGSYL